MAVGASLSRRLRCSREKKPFRAVRRGSPASCSAVRIPASQGKNHASGDAIRASSEKSGYLSTGKIFRNSCGNRRDTTRFYHDDPPLIRGHCLQEGQRDTGCLAGSKRGLKHNRRSAEDGFFQLRKDMVDRVWVYGILV